MTLPCVLAVDIGGTKTAIALGSADRGPPVRRIRFATPPDARRALASVLTRAVRLVAGRRVAAVGVSFGGHVVGEKVRSLHVAGWEDVHLVDALRDAFRAPVQVVNDAEAGAVAEYSTRVRVTPGLRHLVYATVSTGIGGAVIADGEVARGAHGLTGELGHFPVAEQGTCSCGRVGHLEALASGTAIARRVREGLADERYRRSLLHGHGAAVDARAVADAARDGDELACSVLADAGRLVGRALAIMALCVDPEVICLGGGVSQAGDSFWLPLRHEVDAHLLCPVAVEPAIHGSDSALIGAMHLARSQAESAGRVAEETS